METQKLDKRSKEYKDQQKIKYPDPATTTLEEALTKVSAPTFVAPSKSQIEQLISTGISISRAIFHKTIVSINGEPEYAFYAKQLLNNPKPSRMAEMWYTPHGLVTKQSNKTKTEYKIIPLAQVADTTVA